MRIFRSRHQPDNFVLMLVSGWIFKWDLKSAAEVGGSGIADDICVHNGVLYEAGPGGVVSWDTAEWLPTPTKGWATAVCSHGGKLYHAITGPSTADPSMIFETLTGKLVAKRKHMVSSLCSFQNQLFDGGDDGVYETLSGRRITGEQVNVLCPHNGNLYDGRYQEVYETMSGNEVAYRGHRVYALCSHEGTLYDASEFGAVYDTIRNIVALDYANIRHVTKTRTVMGYKIPGGRKEVLLVRRMISVPGGILDRFEEPLRKYKKSIGR